MPETNESGGFLSDEAKQLFLEFKEVEDELDKIAPRVASLKQRREELEEKLVLLMDDAVCPRVVIGGVTFFRRTDRFPRVKDQDGLIRWLAELDRSDLVKPTVNSKSLQSLCIERLDQNQELPECVEMFTRARVQTRHK